MILAPIICSGRTIIGVRCCAVSARLALEHGLLTGSQLDALRPDLEACLPVLRTCRQLLVVIPASREEHPRIGDLLRDHEMLRRLRHVQHAFGEALREEQMSRALDFLDTQER